MRIEILRVVGLLSRPVMYAPRVVNFEFVVLSMSPLFVSEVTDIP
jgi:hypothetical protein